MEPRTALFGFGGALVLVVGLAVAAVGAYVSFTSQCAPGETVDDGCPRVGTWLFYGGGTATVVGFFAALVAWVRYAYG